MTQKKVLVASHHLWNWYFKAGMHFLTQFFIDKGCKVAFITIPFSIFTIINSYRTRGSKKVSSSIKLWLKNGQKEYGGKFISYVPFTLFHPADGLPSLLNSDFAVKHFLDLSLPPLKNWLKREDFYQPDILMVESGLPAAIFRIVKAKKMICRISDDLSDLGRSKAVLTLEDDILKKSDIVLPVCKGIYDSAVKRRGTDKGVYCLPNGVEIDIFQKKVANPPEYSHIPKPRAVYVGGLSNELIDFELLAYVAKDLANVSFVIIGPYSQIPLDKIPSNVHFLGGVPYQKVPAYLQHADVGLIPFKRAKRFEKVERPLKFYQYIASGLPVVSVDYGDLRAMKPYAILANTYEDFSAAIQSALKVTPKYQNSLRNVAQEFSWERIYSQFEAILIKHGILP